MERMFYARQGTDVFPDGLERLKNTKRWRNGKKTIAFFVEIRYAEVRILQSSVGSQLRPGNAVEGSKELKENKGKEMYAGAYRGTQMRKKKLLSMLLSVSMTVSTFAYTAAGETIQNTDTTVEEGLQETDGLTVEELETVSEEPAEFTEDTESENPEPSEEPAQEIPETEVETTVEEVIPTEAPVSEESVVETTQAEPKEEVSSEPSAETAETEPEVTEAPEGTTEAAETEPAETENETVLETEQETTAAEETEEETTAAETTEEETEPESEEETTEEETTGEVTTEEAIVVPVDFGEVPVGGYLPTDKDVNVPAYDSGINKYQSIPSAYPSGGVSGLYRYPQLRNQNPYGTCWAFSTIGLAEFDLINDGSYMSSVDLSELQLAYFTFNSVTDPLGGTSGDYSKYYADIAGAVCLDFGGNYFLATRRLNQWVGAVNESDVPYGDAWWVSNFGLADQYAYNYDVAHLKNAYIINIHQNPNAVKQSIMEHGAVGISYRHLDSGCGQVTSTGEYTYYDTNSAGGGHAVMVVGWDDNYPKERFAGYYQPSNNGAWLVRNSWGNGYMDYFWMSYETYSLRDGAWALDFSKDWPYDNNYQLDGGLDTSTAYMTQAANVFDVNQKSGVASESLKAVSLSLTNSANVSYKIEVYTNLKDRSDPLSGTRQDAATTTGTTSYAGIYTIPLRNQVELLPGTSFSVVVTSNDGIDYETAMWYSNSNGICWDSDVENNDRSFYSYGGSFYEWSSGNFCIKAFTSNNATRSSVSPVSNLRVTKTTASSATLSWNGVSNASGYNVYRYNSTNNTWTYVKSVGSGTTTTITGLKPGVYSYNVKAYVKKNGTVQYSAFTKSVRAAILTKPVIKSATALNSKKIQLTWNSVKGASGYNLYRYNTATKKYDYVKSVRGTTTTDTISKPGTRYCYRVRAYYKNNVDTGTQYSAYSETKLAAGVAAVGGLKTESLIGKGIKISWNKAVGATGYSVYRYNSSTKSWTFLKKTTALNYVDNSVSAGVTYSYKVRPYCKMDDVSCYGQYSSVKKGRYLSRPSSFKAAAAGSRNIKLSWGSVSGAGGYNVYRYNTASGMYEYVASVKGTTYTDKNRTAGRTYKYRVRAYVKADATYYSAYTDPKSVTAK